MDQRWELAELADGEAVVIRQFSLGPAFPPKGNNENSRNMIPALPPLLRSLREILWANVLGLHQVKRYGVDGVGLGGARERVCFAERN